MDKNIEKIILKATKEGNVQLGVGENFKIDYTPTGSIQLDVALRTGGIPSGRVNIIAGREGSFKTTMCYGMIARSQKEGKVCAFFDAEFTFDPNRAKKMGINLDDLVLVRAPDFETHADICCDVLMSGAVDLAVFDSLAGASFKTLNEGETGDFHIGRKAKLISNFVTRIVGIVGFKKNTLILINQLRDNIGGQGNPDIMPGGRALAFSASTIVWLGSVKTEIPGYHGVSVNLKKNKLNGLPGASIKIHFQPDGFIDEAEDLSQVLTNASYAEMLGIERYGSFYTFPAGIFGGEIRLQGQKQVSDKFKGDPQLIEPIKEICLRKLTRFYDDQDFGG